MMIQETQLALSERDAARRLAERVVEYLGPRDQIDAEVLDADAELHDMATGLLSLIS